MIIFDQKRWRQTYISNRNNTGWRCRCCETGVLKLSSKINTRTDHYAINVECSHPKCKEKYGIIGNISFMAGEIKVSKEYYKIDDIRLYPTHFQPVLDLFCLPIDLNDEAVKLIKLSFNQFWYDWDACINKIRQALEVIVLEMNGIGPNLHQRILSLKELLGEDLCDSLIALKWIGNEGSHLTASFEKEQILTTYEILVDILNKLYPNTEEEKRRKKFILDTIKNKGIKKK
jgi:hypothetical protein